MVWRIPFDERHKIVYNIIVMKIIGFFAIFPVILVLSCGTEPKKADPAPVETAPPAAVAQPATPVAVTPPPQPVQSAPPEPTTPPQEPIIPSVETPVQTVQSAPPEEKAFDPKIITEEKFSATKADVKVLIEDLNKIIRAKNYNAWLTYLSDSYFQEISSPAFLEDRTEELYKRDQTVASNLGRDPRRVSKKILRTPKDYFDNVVVPSRSNDRMDDIDFVSENRVKAYTVDNRSHRLVLYDLEMIDNKWKIIN